MTVEAESPRPRPRRGRLLGAVLAAALGLWLWVTIPLATGERTLFFRDVFTTHLPLKAFGAAELRAGRIPVFNPTWGLGQPFRGNPNALPFYPGNALYLLLPFWSAFNLHYALHWLLAFAAMGALARELGQGREGAMMAALAYAGSGWLLSCLSFYNLLAVSAWWPLALWGGARGGRRGIALGGLACGFALLGGEPLLAALGVAPMAVVAVGRAGLRRGLLRSAAIVGLGLLVALPQLVATARVLPFTARGLGLSVAGPPGLYALHPLRLAELLLPLPFGWPGDLGRFGFWADRLAPQVPYVLTLHVGVVALALAFAAARRRRAWAVLAGLSLLLAWLGGAVPGALAAAGGGLFRSPEKFLFWFALAVPLLAGWGVEAALRSRAWRRAALAAAAGAAAGAALLFFWRGSAAARLAPLVAEVALPGAAATQVALWLLGLAAAAGLLALAAWAAARRRGDALVALELVALVQLAPLVMTDEVAPYRQPSPWRAHLPAAAAVVTGTFHSPFGEPAPAHRLADTSMAARYRLAAGDLAPAPGVLSGLTYPLAPDLEGIYSPFLKLARASLPALDWPGRVAWMRAVGADAVVLAEPPAIPGLRPLARADRAGVATVLFGVEGGAPAAWWPRRAVAATSPKAAVGLVARATDPVAQVVVPEPFAPGPPGTVRLLAAGPDRLVLEVASPAGGLVALARAYHPLLRAHAGAARLAVLPVNLCLLGVEVPAGRQRVVVEAAAWPERAAMGVAAVAALTLAALAWGDARRRRGAA